jgi:hypothetical protein
MLRILIDYVLPLLLPSVLWFGWLLWAKPKGGDRVAVPWVWLAAAGVVLALVVTWGGWLRVGVHAGKYHPANIDAAGHLQPGRID